MTLQIVGETLCEAVDLRAGALVPDVCAGNGNSSLAAARRWARVTSTDCVAALLEDGRRRALGDRLAIDFREADVEALPFADAAFDVVLSSFGVMFAPNHVRSAQEMMRVCPTHKAFAALPAEGQARLERDILALLAECNVSGDETLVVPSAFLEAVIVRR